MILLLKMFLSILYSGSKTRKFLCFWLLTLDCFLDCHRFPRNGFYHGNLTEGSFAYSISSHQWLHTASEIIDKLFASKPELLQSWKSRWEQRLLSISQVQISLFLFTPSSSSSPSNPSNPSSPSSPPPPLRKTQPSLGRALSFPAVY